MRSAPRPSWRHGGGRRSSSPGGRAASSCRSRARHTSCRACRLLGRIDTVGAGDSALAGIAAALAARRGAREAAELGNFAAGVTVQKLFTTGTASPAEVLAIGSDPDYVFEPELAADPHRARFHAGTGIEVVTAGPAGRRFTHAIFDNDGTVSTLREGWERIMEPMMIRAILGEGWRTAEERVHRAVQERVRDYIDTTTGIQTLVQMTGLVEMVREFGLVPADRVLDAKGYKAVYNAELLALVRVRLAKLERGEVAAEDFMLNGSLRAARRAPRGGGGAAPRERHRPGGRGGRGRGPRLSPASSRAGSTARSAT